MEYIELEKVNKILSTTDVKGRPYIEVNERIKGFRMLYPTGSILTEMLSNENGVCIFKAEVYDGEGHILGTGTAYEKEGSSFINKTSYIENCETSAVGRALGIAGFGIDTSVASAEEVANAITQQEGMKVINSNQLSTLQALIKSLDNATEFYNNILKTYNIKDLKEMNGDQYGRVLLEIKKIKEEK